MFCILIYIIKMIDRGGLIWTLSFIVPSPNFFSKVILKLRKHLYLSYIRYTSNLKIPHALYGHALKQESMQRG